MPIYKTEDGTVYNVSEENIDKFVQENPSAIDVSSGPYSPSGSSVNQNYNLDFTPPDPSVETEVEREKELEVAELEVDEQAVKMGQLGLTKPTITTERTVTTDPLFIDPIVEPSEDDVKKEINEEFEQWKQETGFEDSENYRNMVDNFNIGIGPDPEAVAEGMFTAQKKQEEDAKIKELYPDIDDTLLDRVSKWCVVYSDSNKLEDVKVAIGRWKETFGEKL